MHTDFIVCSYRREHAASKKYEAYEAETTEMTGPLSSVAMRIGHTHGIAFIAL